MPSREMGRRLRAALAGMAYSLGLLGPDMSTRIAWSFAHLRTPFGAVTERN